MSDVSGKVDQTASEQNPQFIIQRLYIVIAERMRQRPRLAGHAEITRRRAYIPVLPTVIAACDDLLFAGICPR